MPAAQLIDLAKTKGRKPILYSLVSVISVAVSQIALVIAHAVFGLGAEVSNVIAVAAGTVPSYSLNRRWVWGKATKSHLWKEVVPFWVLSFIGLVFSTVVVAVDRETFVRTPKPSARWYGDVAKANALPDD